MSRPGLIKVRCAPATSRAGVDVARSINVDRDALIIHNVAIMQANVEALGHGVMSDDTTIRQCAMLGNQPSRGIQGHLGHPGMSENSSGKQFYTCRNFYVAGDRLLADLHMFEPARRAPVFTFDPVQWMMDMAEQHPDQLAMSAVIGMQPVWIMEDGSEESAEVDDFGDNEELPYSATTPLPVIRVEAFYNADVVEEGALTYDGLFSVDTPAFYSQELFEILDEWRAQFRIPLEDVPKKAHQFASKYVNSRKGKQVSINTNSKTKASVNRKRATGFDAEADTLIVSGSPGETATLPNEPQSDEESTQPANTGNDVLDTLASAQASNAEAADTLTETPDDREAVQVETPEQQELVAQVNRLEQEREQDHQTIVALAYLVDDQGKLIVKMSKRIAALENEDVVSEQVAGVRTLAAARSALASLVRPTHVSQRIAKGEQSGTAVVNGDEARMSIAASQQRVRSGNPQ